MSVIKTDLSFITIQDCDAIKSKFGELKPLQQETLHAYQNELHDNIVEKFNNIITRFKQLHTQQDALVIKFEKTANEKKFHLVFPNQEKNSMFKTITALIGKTELIFFRGKFDDIAQRFNTKNSSENFYRKKIVFINFLILLTTYVDIKSGIYTYHDLSVDGYTTQPQQPLFANKEQRENMVEDVEILLYNILIDYYEKSRIKPKSLNLNSFLENVFYDKPFFENVSNKIDEFFRKYQIESVELPKAPQIPATHTPKQTHETTTVQTISEKSQTQPELKLIQGTTDPIILEQPAPTIADTQELEQTQKVHTIAAIQEPIHENVDSVSQLIQDATFFEPIIQPTQVDPQLSEVSQTESTTESTIAETLTPEQTQETTVQTISEKSQTQPELKLIQGTTDPIILAQPAPTIADTPEQTQKTTVQTMSEKPQTHPELKLTKETTDPIILAQPAPTIADTPKTKQETTVQKKQTSKKDFSLITSQQKHDYTKYDYMKNDEGTKKLKDLIRKRLTYLLSMDITLEDPSQKKGSSTVVYSRDILQQWIEDVTGLKGTTDEIIDETINFKLTQLVAITNMALIFNKFAGQIKKEETYGTKMPEELRIAYSAMRSAILKKKITPLLSQFDAQDIINYACENANIIDELDITSDEYLAFLDKIQNKNKTNKNRNIVISVTSFLVFASAFVTLTNTSLLAIISISATISVIIASILAFAYYMLYELIQNLFGPTNSTRWHIISSCAICSLITLVAVAAFYAATYIAPLLPAIISASQLSTYLISFAGVFLLTKIITYSVKYTATKFKEYLHKNESHDNTTVQNNPTKTLVTIENPNTLQLTTESSIHLQNNETRIPTQPKKLQK